MYKSPLSMKSKFLLSYHSFLGFEITYLIIYLLRHPCFFERLCKDLFNNILSNKWLNIWDFEWQVLFIYSNAVLG